MEAWSYGDSSMVTVELRMNRKRPNDMTRAVYAMRLVPKRGELGRVRQGCVRCGLRSLSHSSGPVQLLETFLALQNKAQ